MKRVNLRLDVTEDERNTVRRAAAFAGYRSMAEFCRTAVLNEARRLVDKVVESHSQSLNAKDTQGESQD